MTSHIRAAVRGAILAGVLTTAGLPTVYAQSPAGNSSEGALEEIVVTAQFREERLQTTPIAISAFTADAMEARGLDNVTDLGAFVPNTVIQPLGAGWGATMAAFIRGIGLGDNILSFEPGVPIYVDDVYIGRPQGAMFDLLDLERVEVLRGPQGTLFGKNAIGGTIRMISKKPKGDGSGSVSLTTGSRHRIDARGMLDVSLVPDRVMARFSFSSKNADGYFNVLDYECVNGAGSLGDGGTGLPDSGGPAFPGALPGGQFPVRLGSQVAPGSGCVVDTLGDEHVQSGRAAFRFILGDNVEFNLIGDVTDQRQKGPADKYTIMDGAGGGGLNGFWNGVFAEPIFGAGVGWDSRFITDDMYSNYSRYNDPITNRSVPNINNLNHWGVSGTLEWKLGENLNLKSVTGYRRFWNKFGRDSDGSPLPVDGTYDDNRHRQVTQELQLTGTAGRLDWATGAFYYDAHDSNRGFGFLYPTIIQQQDSFDQQDTTNWAVFAQGTWHVSDQLSLTGGARYTDDEKNATIYRATFYGDVVIPNDFVPTSATNTDYSVSVDYRWTDTFMTYAKYATGFRGGGFSPRPSNSLQTLPFGPEELKTFEVGGKSELLNRRLRLNGAVFMSEYNDQQTFGQQFDSSGANWFRTSNAGKADILGVEAELLAEPVENLRIEASFGYLDYELTDRETNTLLLEGNNCAGERCYSPRTPKYTGAVGVQYEFAAFGGSLTPRLDAAYQSTIYFGTNNGCSIVTETPTLVLANCGTGAQHGYTMLNGRVTWASDNKDWELALYGRNLGDKEYFNGKLSLVGFFGREQGNVGAPREYGLTVKRNF